MSQIVFQQGATARMTTSKTYDFLNRLTQISSTSTAGSNVSFAYSYNNANQRVVSRLADGSYWRYQYDSLGQVTSGHKYFSDGTPVPGQQFDYAFDTIGNRTQTKRGGDASGANQRAASYSANLLNQYTSRTVPGYVDIMGLAYATNPVTVNGYTAWRKGEYFREELSVANGSAPVWEGVTVSASGQAMVNGSQFVQQTPESFAYDLDGNLTSDGRWTYGWDAENRLVSLAARTSVGPGISLKFEYDAKGRRIRKQVWPNTNWNGSSTNDTRFLYDGWSLISEVTSSYSPVRGYLWGLDLSGSPEGAGGIGGLLEVVYYGSSTTNSFVAFDGNGNVSALVNAADGTLVGQYEYGPFGEVIRATGPMAKANPFRFSTKYQDDETDLVYYGYRYLTTSGRWLNRDPLGTGGGLNEYAFAANNAASRVDKLGLNYSLVALPPTGWWILSLRDNIQNESTTLKGFDSRYLPSDGKFGHPPCPCARENIILAQVVKDPLYRTIKFDVGPDPAKLPPHKADDPIPPFERIPQPFTIEDAPHFTNISPITDTTWHFEDCAICRTHSGANSINDQVLGCIRFDFTRHTDGTISISVFIKGGSRTGHPFYVEDAHTPTKFWDDGVKNWVATGGK